MIDAPSRPKSLSALTAHLESSFQPATVNPEVQETDESKGETFTRNAEGKWSGDKGSGANATEADAESPLCGLTDELDRCDTLASVNQCEASYIVPDHTWKASEVDYIKTSCNARRDEIRAKRGERSNQAALNLGEGNAP